MTELDIAVVIVTYKRAALTIDSLRSVAAEQSTAGFHLRAIVVDNASGDAPAIAEAIESNGWRSWVTLVSAGKNGGFAYGNNLGITRAYEPRVPSYIYLLNPDVQIRPGAIGSLARFLESHPEAGIAGSSFENLDGSDWPIAFHFPSLMSEMLQGMELGPLTRLFKRSTVAQHMTKTPQPIDWICGASMLIRPAVLESIGGMDENYFLYFEETDFCYRAKKAAPGVLKLQTRTERLALASGRRLADFMNFLMPGKREAAMLLVANERTRGVGCAATSRCSSRTASISRFWNSRTLKALDQAIIKAQGFYRHGCETDLYSRGIVAEF
jgi:GT2 family glycosyltransferase